MTTRCQSFARLRNEATRLHWSSATFVLLLVNLTGWLLTAGCFNTGNESNNIVPRMASPNAVPTSPVEPGRNRLEDETAVLDELDKFGAKFSVVSLRSKRLQEDDRELRIWVGFGPDKTRGLIVASNSAKYLLPIGDIGRETDMAAQSLVPASAWDSFWSGIIASGLLNLPKEPESEKIDPREDSDVIVVEMKDGSNYKYIVYGAPCHSQWRNAKTLVAAIAKISRGLQVDFYQCPHAPT